MMSDTTPPQTAGRTSVEQWLDLKFYCQTESVPRSTIVPCRDVDTADAQMRPPPNEWCHVVTCNPDVTPFYATNKKTHACQCKSYIWVRPSRPSQPLTLYRSPENMINS